MKKFKCSDVLFSFFIFVIVLVSMVDLYYTIKLQRTILRDEQNPIGVWLINIDGGDVSLFMTVKMLMLWVVYCIVKTMYKRSKKWGLVVAGSLCLAQILLVLYFLFGYDLQLWLGM